MLLLFASARAEFPSLSKLRVLCDLPFCITDTVRQLQNAHSNDLFSMKSTSDLTLQSQQSSACSFAWIFGRIESFKIFNLVSPLEMLHSSAPETKLSLAVLVDVPWHSCSQNQ